MDKSTHSTHRKRRVNQGSFFDEEKQVVEQMIRLYCRRKEKNRQLCHNCQELITYANRQVDHCPVKWEGTTCRTCKIHCYTPQQREKIKEVMRYAAPWMLFFHPLLTLKHMWRELQKHFL